MAGHEHDQHGIVSNNAALDTKRIASPVRTCDQGGQVDPDERWFRAEELALKKRDEARQVEDLAIKKSAARGEWTRSAAVVIAAIALFVPALGIWNAQKQANRTARDNHYSSAQANYIAMVDQLGNDRPEVRILAVRRLVQFVEDPSNYSTSKAGRCNQSIAEGNLTQAFETSLENEAHLPPKDKLTSFANAGPPDDAYRIVTQLNYLSTEGVAADSSQNKCTQHDFYLNNLDLHGASLAGWRPKAAKTFTFTRMDLRQANLSGLDLRAVAPRQHDVPGRTGVTLTSNNAACVNLDGANLGTADLANTNLTGADLSSANLSSVIGLRQSQILHATTDAHTQLPPGIARSADAWKRRGTECTAYISSLNGTVVAPN